MATYAAAVIGTGAQAGGTEETGSAMGYRHGNAYDQHSDCELVACADIDQTNSQRFAENFDIPPGNAYTDYHEMFAEVDLEVVSITTPIPTHADIVIDSAREGDLEAIHCEKPMADNWGDATLMAQECDRRDVQLTFNHQLRYSGPVVRARELIEDGEIGEVQRVEGARSDLLESGIHQLDLCSDFAGDVPGSWVLGAIDYPEEQRRHGIHIENQALGIWEYENGVFGLASMGAGEAAIGTRNRVIGTKGEIAVNFWGGDALTVKRDSADPEHLDIELGESLVKCVANVVDCIGTDEEPRVAAHRSMIANEIGYGIYESVRRRGRVELPLDSEDNPVDDLIARGELFGN